MNRDFSLIDGVTERAEEGLRVLEDIARFVLRNEGHFATLKTMRHQMLEIEERLGSSTMLGGRVGEDIGERKVVKTEYDRSSLLSIIQANAKRAAQALRSLEEFAKVYSTTSAYQCESMRYELYVLEHKLARQTPYFWLKTYFEQGIVYPLSDSVEELQRLIRHGAKIVQLREKNPTLALEKGAELVSFIHAWNKQQIEPVLLIINDFPDVVAQLPVAGVHVGQDVVDLNRVRRVIGSNKIVGRSNTSLEQIQESIEDGADYVSIGPVFATPTKPDRVSVGLDTVQEVANKITTPWVAIGGIDRVTAKEVYRAGAKNVAVVRSARAFFE